MNSDKAAGDYCPNCDDNTIYDYKTCSCGYENPANTPEPFEKLEIKKNMKLEIPAGTDIRELFGEPTCYAQMADIRGKSPGEIDEAKAKLRAGRDRKLRELAFIDGEVFYTEEVKEFSDRIEHRILVYDNEAVGQQQMLEAHGIADFKKVNAVSIDTLEDELGAEQQ